METEPIDDVQPPQASVHLSAGHPFSRSRGERVLRAAGMFFGRGDVHPSELKQGSYRAEQSRVFLTTERLVVTHVRPYLLFGPLIWIIFWLRKRRILVAIPLASVAVIEIGTAKVKYFVVWTVDGQKFSFKPIYRAHYDIWAAAVTKQVAAVRTDADVVTEGQSTFFQARAAS